MRVKKFIFSLFVIVIFQSSQLTQVFSAAFLHYDDNVYLYNDTIFVGLDKEGKLAQNDFVGQKTTLKLVNPKNPADTKQIKSGDSVAFRFVYEKDKFLNAKWPLYSISLVTKIEKSAVFKIYGPVEGGPIEYLSGARIKSYPKQERWLNVKDKKFVHVTDSMIWRFVPAIKLLDDTHFDLKPALQVPITQLDVAGKYIVGIGKNGHLYLWDGSAWKTLVGPQPFHCASIGEDGTIVVISRGGQAYMKAGEGFRSIGGENLIKVSAANKDVIWAVDKNQKVYKWEGDKWALVLGADLKDVSVAFYTYAEEKKVDVWGIKTDNAIVRLEDVEQNRWIAIEGKAEKIFVGGMGNVACLTKDGNLQQSLNPFSKGQNVHWSLVMKNIEDAAVDRYGNWVVLTKKDKKGEQKVMQDALAPLTYDNKVLSLAIKEKIPSAYKSEKKAL